MARLSFSVDRILHSQRPRLATNYDTSNSGGESESPGNSPPASPTYPFVMYPPHALIVGGPAGFATLPLPLSNIHPGIWSSPRVTQHFGYRGKGGAFPPAVSPTKTVSHCNDKDQDNHESDEEEDFVVDDTGSFEKNSADFTTSQIQSKLYKKKRRTTFTNNQLQELENKFIKQKYLTKLDRCMLADSLGLTEKHIKTWYQNRRTKWKKECTNATWSKEREVAAAAMYNQYVQIKAFKTSPDTATQSTASTLS